VFDEEDQIWYEDTQVLVTINDERCEIYSYGKKITKECVIRDLGTEEEAEKFKHMKDYDFNGMKIVNSHVALNSKYFCVGMVGEFKGFKGDHKAVSIDRKNDKRSILGIFKFDPETLTCSIEQWIN